MRYFYRFISAFILLSFVYLHSFATVTITSATGGTGISADKSVGSGSAAFSPLGNITVGSSTISDFTAGTNVTFVLTVPANWQFQAGVGSVSTTGTMITGASVVVTATTVTVTLNGIV